MCFLFKYISIHTIYCFVKLRNILLKYGNYKFWSLVVQHNMVHTVLIWNSGKQIDYCIIFWACALTHAVRTPRPTHHARLQLDRCPFLTSHRCLNTGATYSRRRQSGFTKYSNWPNECRLSEPVLGDAKWIWGVYLRSITLPASSPLSLNQIAVMTLLGRH